MPAMRTFLIFSVFVGYLFTSRAAAAKEAGPSREIDVTANVGERGKGNKPYVPDDWMKGAFSKDSGTADQEDQLSKKESPPIKFAELPPVENIYGNAIQRIEVIRPKGYENDPANKTPRTVFRESLRGLGDETLLRRSFGERTPTRDRYRLDPKVEDKLGKSHDPTLSDEAPLAPIVDGAPLFTGEKLEGGMKLKTEQDPRINLDYKAKPKAGDGADVHSVRDEVKGVMNLA